MNDDAKLSLFLLLGQTATKSVAAVPGSVPTDSLMLSPTYDLASLMPEHVRQAVKASEGYRLFFSFEGYLRELVVDVLSKDSTSNWWEKVPKDVQDEVAKLEQTEEMKRWMALGSRDKSALMTYPQLLRSRSLSRNQAPRKKPSDDTYIAPRLVHRAGLGFARGQDHRHQGQHLRRRPPDDERHRLLDGYVPGIDATVVTRILAARRRRLAAPCGRMIDDHASRITRL